MKYKLLIFDLDGTAFATGGDSLPSSKIVQAVKMAKKHVLVSVATARQLFFLKDIFKIFDLDTPCIIMGGTMIIDPKTHKIIWQKILDVSTVQQVASIVRKYPGEIILGDGPIYKNADDFEVGECQIIYLRNPERQITESIVNELKSITGINYVITPSFIHGWLDIHITNIEATKKHAVE